MKRADRLLSLLEWSAKREFGRRFMGDGLLDVISFDPNTYVDHARSDDGSVTGIVLEDHALTIKLPPRRD